MRIAMWSGPRNLSTAMMYSFGNREDFAVWDEPFYSPYLKATKLDHPLASEIIEAHDSDPESVARTCLGPIPDGKPNFYMKHMPHHMVEGFPLEWANDCVNVHLIRHPARVAASYANKRQVMTLEDIGYLQQLEIYKSFGGIVVDSADIRENPKGMLSALCEAIGLEFDPGMLAWPAGPKPADGIWAKHWYNAVHTSIGFAGPEGPLPELSSEQAQIVAEAMPTYEEMAAQKLCA